MSELEHLRYPVGRFKYEGLLDEALRQQYIDTIAQYPARLRALVAQLSPTQIDTPYRPGGWTARQVIHHTADSHLNSFIRFKLGMTEESPTIKPYLESEWAKSPDYLNVPVNVSIDLLTALHHRWVVLLRSMKEDDWNREVYHPEMKKNISLDFLLALYEWHCRHHLAHVGLAA